MVGRSTSCEAEKGDHLMIVQCQLITHASFLYFLFLAITISSLKEKKKKKRERAQGVEEAEDLLSALN